MTYSGNSIVRTSQRADKLLLVSPNYSGNDRGNSSAVFPMVRPGFRGRGFSQGQWIFNLRSHAKGKVYSSATFISHIILSSRPDNIQLLIALPSLNRMAPPSRSSTYPPPRNRLPSRCLRTREQASPKAHHGRFRFHLSACQDCGNGLRSQHHRGLS